MFISKATEKKKEPEGITGASPLYYYGRGFVGFSGDTAGSKEVFKHASYYWK